MTKTLDGLRSSLGRTASAGVVAIGEMQADALLAELSDAQKTELAAKLAPGAAAGAPVDDNDEDDGKKPCPTCKDPMKDGKCAACDKSAAVANANAGGDRVKAVAHAVANDDACKGKADLALAMLADEDFAGLSASALVKMVARTPVDGASANAGNPEAAARAEMQAALAAQRNSNVNANGGAAPTAAADNEAGWKKATAKINRMNGLGG